MLPLSANKSNQGFTLLETATIVVVVGILAAISAPSLLGWYNRTKVDSALNEVRGALQQAQREAMRKGKVCQVELIEATASEQAKVNNCIFSRTLSKGVQIDPSNGSTISFGFRGNTNNNNTIRVYFSDNPVPEQKCLAVSMPLGIMRTGTYKANGDPKCQKQ
ncbi:MAG: hypothetical protein BRC52_15180 [Cyanobacteria bacterium SW_5_48_44]|nr:MAG: hypothetical protein BRC52_15180 [Cyanobacteria bacterium SW_5_48_44]